MLSYLITVFTGSYYACNRVKGLIFYLNTYTLEDMRRVREALRNKSGKPGL